MPANKPRRKAGHSAKRRPASDSKSRIWAVITGVGIVLLIAFYISQAQENDHTISLPDGNSLLTVKTNPAMPEQLVRYTGMDVSFNAETHEPNWVAWELLGSETSGETSRHSTFQTDPDVPGCARTEDYRGSGYDRGHMAPAGDMKWSAQAMKESFFLTNICPQNGDLNRNAWNTLEQKCRQRAVTDSALVIVTGPIFRKGEGIQRIGATGIAVPRQFFKVILSPYASPPYAIGFIMPNGPTKGGIEPYAVSVDSVEALTGHDFFSALPDELENKLESTADFQAFSRVPRRNKKHNR